MGRKGLAAGVAISRNGVTEEFLNGVAEYDARLAAMLAHEVLGGDFSGFLQRFHRLKTANTRTHSRLDEGYVCRVLDLTDDAKILERLKEGVLLHGLGLF